jgi:urocanate hydratase
MVMLFCLRLHGPVPIFLMRSGEFRYPSYVQDIMGPLCFDYGFGPFRWVCSSNDPSDLERSDAIATEHWSRLMKSAPGYQSADVRQYSLDKRGSSNNLVVGSQARILYADAEGRLPLPGHLTALLHLANIGTGDSWDAIITMYREQIHRTARLQHL